jgi:hypothetical protein
MKQNRRVRRISSRSIASSGEPTVDDPDTLGTFVADRGRVRGPFGMTWVGRVSTDRRDDDACVCASSSPLTLASIAYSPDEKNLGVGGGCRCVSSRQPTDDSVLILQADQNTDASVIHALVATLSAHGFDNLLFAVKNR